MFSSFEKKNASIKYTLTKNSKNTANSKKLKIIDKEFKDVDKLLFNFLLYNYRKEYIQ